MNLYTKVKPFLLSICLLIWTIALFGIGIQIKPLQFASVILFGVACIWIASEFWKCKTGGRIPLYKMTLQTEEMAVSTLIAILLILGCFGNMFFFHQKETGLSAALHVSAFAVAIPFVIWIYVSKINQLATKPARLVRF